MFGDPDLYNVKQLKETGVWPLTFLSAYGMLPYIRRMHGNALVGCEIGVLKGENVYTLLSECDKIGKIYGIDPYVAHTDYETKRTKSQMDQFLKIAEDNLAEFGDRYELVKSKSSEAASMFGKDFFDFVLVDGDHSYKSVKKDLELYWPFLKPGATIFVHDSNREDVIKAIHDFRNENKIRMPIHKSKNFVDFWVNDVRS